MEGNVVSNLCSLPATDLNFTSELNRATAYQIKQAIETMQHNGGKNKGRIKACERELENRRLTKKDKHGKYVSKEHLSILCNTFSSEHRIKAILNKLGEYEDAERQGLLLRLPCRVGTIAYVLSDRIIKVIITRYDCFKDGSMWFCFNHGCGKSIAEFGKTVFLTKSEAEAKLKELRGGENESNN